MATSEMFDKNARFVLQSDAFKHVTKRGNKKLVVSLRPKNFAISPIFSNKAIVALGCVFTLAKISSIICRASFRCARIDASKESLAGVFFPSKVVFVFVVSSKSPPLPILFWYVELF